MNVFLSEKKVFIKYKTKRLVTFLLLFFVWALTMVLYVCTLKSKCKNVFKAPVSATVAPSSSRKKGLSSISSAFDTVDLRAILMILLI